MVVVDVGATEVVVVLVLVVVVGEVVVLGGSGVVDGLGSVVVVVEVEVDVEVVGMAPIVVSPEPVSLPAFGSAVADTDAVFVIDVPAATVGSTWTTTLKDAVAPAASDAYVTVTRRHPPRSPVS